MGVEAVSLNVKKLWIAVFLLIGSGSVFGLPDLPKDHYKGVSDLQHEKDNYPVYTVPADKLKKWSAASDLAKTTESKVEGNKITLTASAKDLNAIATVLERNRWYHSTIDRTCNESDPAAVAFAKIMSDCMDQLFDKEMMKNATADNKYQMTFSGSDLNVCLSEANKYMAWKKKAAKDWKEYKADDELVENLTKLGKILTSEKIDKFEPITDEEKTFSDKIAGSNRKVKSKLGDVIEKNLCRVQAGDGGTPIAIPSTPSDAASTTKAAGGPAAVAAAPTTKAAPGLPGGPGMGCTPGYGGNCGGYAGGNLGGYGQPGYGYGGGQFGRPGYGGNGLGYGGLGGLGGNYNRQPPYIPPGGGGAPPPPGVPAPIPPPIYPIPPIAGGFGFRGGYGGGFGGGYPPPMMPPFFPPPMPAPLPAGGSGYVSPFVSVASSAPKKEKITVEEIKKPMPPGWMINGKWIPNPLFAGGGMGMGGPGMGGFGMGGPGMGMPGNPGFGFGGFAGMGPGGYNGLLINNPLTPSYPNLGYGYGSSYLSGGTSLGSIYNPTTPLTYTPSYSPTYSPYYGSGSISPVGTLGTIGSGSIYPVGSTVGVGTGSISPVGVGTTVGGSLGSIRPVGTGVLYPLGNQLANTYPH